MSDPVITAENLSKHYLVGHRAERESYPALRDIVGRELRNAARKTADLIRGRQIVQGDEVEEFWALKNVSFEVQEGEVLGIIGRNGTGKSTLLKILSRITRPTTGRITVRGRVASLLEVGTGFHPELSGRENIYLNGAILGMSRGEIRRKFDEIIAFAEVEKFLDTPVKRYSSGMYVRLAFAVAAHLEPEILIVDEVLAVGDAEFQRKCLGKMEEVSRQGGRTVIFVSHNLDAVARICHRGILLSAGRTVFAGSARHAVAEYNRLSRRTSRALDDFRQHSSSSSREFDSVYTANVKGEVCSTFAPGESFQIIIHVRLPNAVRRDFAVAIESHDSHPLFSTQLSDLATLQPFRGEVQMRIRIDNPALRSGEYLVSLASLAPGDLKSYDVILHFPLFKVVGHEASFPSNKRWGDLYFPFEWSISEKMGNESDTPYEALPTGSLGRLK